MTKRLAKKIAKNPEAYGKDDYRRAVRFLAKAARKNLRRLEQRIINRIVVSYQKLGFIS
jgi:hypothetical protein